MTTHPSGNNDDDKTNASAQAAPLPPSPFTTTTDVMNSLNKVMQQYHNPDQDGELSSSAPAFELQRKLPDGSSRKASPSELKAADLETKIKQVAQHVASLPNEQAKLDFLNQQRQYGNQLYIQKEYEQAMDVYLTCLTAIPTTNRGQSLVFLQVLNNLAQTAMQLTWYRKAQDFCRLALEEVYNSEDAVVDVAAIPAERQVQIAKLYFKRGKASRCKGEYEAARNDLTQALSVLAAMNVDDDNDSDNHAPVIESSRKAIRKELQAVQVAAQEGRRNKLRHQKAMQKVLGGGQPKDKESAAVTTTTATATSNTRKSSNSVTFVSKDTSIAPLYDDMPRGRQRAYSTLRAPTTPIHNNNDGNDDVDDDDLTNVPMGLRYWYYYIRMVGRVAETLLEWIGDDEKVEERHDGTRPTTKADKMD